MVNTEFNNIIIYLQVIRQQRLKVNLHLTHWRFSVVVMYATLYFLLVIYGSVHKIIVLLPSILWFMAVSANHYIELNYVCFHFNFIYACKNTLDTLFVVRNRFANIISSEFLRNAFDVCKLSVDRVFKI